MFFGQETIYPLNQVVPKDDNSKLSENTKPIKCQKDLTKIENSTYCPYYKNVFIHSLETQANLFHKLPFKLAKLLSEIRTSNINSLEPLLPH